MDQRHMDQRNVVSGAAARTVVQAGAVSGGVHIHASASLPPMGAPWELPAAPRVWVDRTDERARLAAIVGAAATRESPVVVLGGPPGIGKSALAITALAEVTDQQYPGGVLYEDLAGAASAGSDAGSAAAGALARWLRASGVHPELVLPDLDGLQGQWRGHTRARATAVLLELPDLPARTGSALVRSLRPGAGLTIVTTRRRMMELAVVDDAELVTIDPLDDAASAELITQLITRTAPVPPDVTAVRMLAERCAGVPLAARLLIGRIAARRPIGSADLVERLSTIPLGETMSDQTTAAVAALSDSGRAALQLLGLHPEGHSWPIGAAAELLDVSHADVDELIDELTDHHLVDVPQPGRYRLPRLVEEHARRSATELPEAARKVAIARMATWYVMQAAGCEHARNAHRRAMSRIVTAARELDAATVPPAEALDWLDAMQPVVAAIQRLAYDTGLFELAYAAAEAYWGWCMARHAHPQWEDMSRLGIAAAEALGDDVRQARMLGLYSVARRDADDVEEAADAVENAMRLATQAGDQLGRATAFEQRAHLRRAAGTYGEAIACCEAAIEIYQRLGGLHRSLGLVLRLAGDTYIEALRAGQTEPDDDFGGRALDAHGKALDHFSRIDDAHQLGRTMISLSEAFGATGQYGDAAIRAGGAIEILQPYGQPMTLAHAQMALAEARAAQWETHGDAGQLARARDSLAEAARTYEGLDLRADHPALRHLKDLAERLAERTDSAGVAETTADTDDTAPAAGGPHDA